VIESDLRYHHLEGIKWTGIGRDDCFALGRKFYKDNFDIDIPDVVRPSDWNSDDLDLLELWHEKIGFKKLTDFRPKDLRPGDVLCMAVGERNPNHIAIFAGDNTIIHHLFGRFSRAEPFREFWFNQTSYILRHPDVPDLRPVYPDVDIRDLLSVRNAVPTE
jgi:cell wall-associated NlpC family hydrolase